MAPTFISLFSGCGGLDLGFLQAGYQSIGAFDINPNALAVLHQNTSSPVFETDLSVSQPPAVLLKQADVFLSGSPCQGFSTIGKRQLNDPRNQLLLVGGDLVRKYKPKIYVSENVPGAIVGKHRVYWDQLHQMLKSAGYQTYDLKVKASDFGVAQERKRIFLVAWRQKVNWSFHLPQNLVSKLSDVLSNLEGLPNHDPKHLAENSKQHIIATKIRPGQKLCNVRGGDRAVHTWDIPEVFGSVTMEERSVLESMIQLRRRIRVRDFGDADPVPTELLAEKFGASVIESLEQKEYLRKIGKNHDITRAFNGKFRRLDGEKLSYTVDTRFGNPNFFLHPQEHRGLTVREAARIQGFPDDFIFSGGISEQYSIIGNAVPPPMAKYIADYLKNILL
ncbi:MAG: DNA cytosine methyltransferase [bacterium]|nr:DNA cytosine methyltransferase [bacterium]